MPINLRNIILKLPYKLRERWRTVACDLQEQRGRVVFTDLVTFSEKQVKIVSHPLFGNIQESQSASHNKAPTQIMQIKGDTEAHLPPASLQ